ncbi:2'-5' RNA ligase [Verrucomicrobia bacterium]|nr:2'-5' RNA ligase [Verrucomicrobiota bacterium]
MNPSSSPLGPATAGPLESWRLFLAVRVPAAIQAELEKAQAELRQALSDSGRNCVRWSPREQFHLTLNFLGNVAASQVPNLMSAVNTVCGVFEPLYLRAEGVGFFPNRGTPRVVWAGVQDRQKLLSGLQQALAAAVQDFCPEAETARNSIVRPAATEKSTVKPFSGHVTLGRGKDLTRREAELLNQKASGMARRFFGEWTADDLAIFRSELSAEGARHTLLARAPFRQPAAPTA